MLMIFICFNHFVFAEKLRKVYNIKRNGALIGKLYFNQDSEGENISLKITSEINTRLIFRINVKTEDLAHFKGEKLISSAVSRMVNGNEREIRKTSLTNDGYQLQSGTKLASFKHQISSNMMLLYIKEPVDLKPLYSDHYQSFVDVKKIAVHKYRVNLPDGNYNEYYFDNSVCKLITINHSLYTITMELV